jgi:hypothetical protein
MVFRVIRPLSSDDCVFPQRQVDDGHTIRWESLTIHIGTSPVIAGHISNLERQ